MSMVSRAARGAVRGLALAGRSTGRALRVVVFLLLVGAALFVPAPILGRPRFERPGRRNQPTEVDRRR